MSMNIGEKVRYMLIFYLSFTIKNLYINSFCKLFQKVQRISQIQKKKLVDYMSANLEFARGQFGGINSNNSYREKWEALRISLNSTGGSDKSVEQWKKVC